jgi:subtilisin family serine protease
MEKLFLLSAKLFRILLAFLVFGFCFGCQKEFLQTENANEPEALGLKSAKTTNFMVITKSETLPAGFVEQLSSYGQIVSSIPEIGVLVVKPTTSNFQTKVAKLTEVKAVVPDLMVKWLEPDKFISEANPPSIGDNETFFWRQWGMDAIDAPEAWNAGHKGETVRVFILDSGIDADNPDLLPNLNTSLSTSFVPGETYNVAPGSFFNHGTHVAGIVAAADNDWGVIGVAPSAEIVAVKVLSEFTGSGEFSWVNAGIVYAANNGANVINMSLGGTFNRNGFYYDENDILQKVPAVELQNLIIAQQRAVNYAFRKGVVIVVSAGNGGSNYDGNGSIFKLPAELQNVIAVSATAPYSWYSDILNGVPNPILDIPASYTDYGKSLVAIAAPGGDFDSDDVNWFMDMVISSGAGPNAAGNYPFYYAAGTSMAAPHVAGVAALIIAKNGGKMSPQEVTKQLIKTADKIDGNGTSAYYGKGRVNAFRAVTE